MVGRGEGAGAEVTMCSDNNVLWMFPLSTYATCSAQPIVRDLLSLMIFTGNTYILLAEEV